MKKDIVLLNYLKRLSPLFEKLVEKALKEQINIIRFKTFFERMRKHGKEPLDVYMFGAVNYPKIGLKKTIVVFMTWLPRTIKEGDLGVAEMNFAHEIGHNLSWSDKPFCAYHPSSEILCLRCNYFEVLADKLGFDILKELNPGKSFKLLFCGRPTKPLEVYCDEGFPSKYLESYKTCRALRVHNLDGCPREKEIRELVEVMKKLKL